MTYFLSRQKYWPDGDLVIEIAKGGRDYANPDMLAPKYRGEGEEYEDPREALDIALDIRDMWIQDSKGEVRIEHGFTGGATLPFCSEPTDEELKEWAQKAYEELPKCARCGDILGKERYHDPNDDDRLFCSEYCAEEDYWRSVCDEDCDSCQHSDAEGECML